MEKGFYFRNKGKRAEVESKVEQKPVRQIRQEINFPPPPVVHVRQQLPEHRALHKQDSVSRRSQPKPVYFYTLYILGVPLQYKQKDVIYVLGEKKIRVKYYEWKMREDMEYLFVELYEGLSQSEVMALQVYIDRFPLLVGVKGQEETLHDIVMKHQVEINFEKEINEVELMKCGGRVGGVMSLVKDEFYGPRKYVAVLSSLSKLAKFTSELELVFKNFKLSPPKHPIRVGRLQRNFTFSVMIQNLSSYEQELRGLQERGVRSDAC